MNDRTNEAVIDIFPTRIATCTADFDACRGPLLEAARIFLESHLKRISLINDQGGSGREVVQELTATFDQLNDNLYKAVSADLRPEEVAGCALLGLGGYGRGEMNPRSDLDLMFFYEPSGKAAARIISDRMLYLLWDLSLDVGYSVRSSKDCLEESKDSTVRTSLLDARFISGNPDLFELFAHTVGNIVLTQDTQSFIDLKLEERSERKKKYGSSVYLLEPNLKEGEGGLRELQDALWIARVKFKVSGVRELLIKGVVNEQEADEYLHAQDYLWKIRNFLHFSGQRKSDQLTFELQQKIADFLGYKKDPSGSAVEKFMQDYYAQAIRIEHL
ncbi:MAG: [protein-PII] uridylyltransferase, partial [Desulfofustis sp.]|nr:[protein-PII] uridylyltransferase [Desulfofustis sp.]